MKKATIIGVLLLLASSGAIAAVYQFYVKERLADYAKHLEEGKRLHAKIETMQETFSQTRPDVVIAEWRRKAQPWAMAVDQRAEYFRLAVLPETSEPVALPTDAIPRFWYKSEYPKLRDAIVRHARANNCVFNPNFGVPDDNIGGNPTAADVVGYIEKINYYSSIARMLIDRKARSISTIYPWPVRTGYDGRRGTVKYHTVGLVFSMTTRDFVEFLEWLRTQDRFVTVDSLFVKSAVSLRAQDPNPPLEVQMVLTQAEFARKGGVGGAGPSATLDVQAAFTSLSFEGGGSPFGGRPIQKKTWWQRFRRAYLPF